MAPVLKDDPDRWRPTQILGIGIESQKSEHDSRWGMSSATTPSVVFIALDEACEQEVVDQKPTYDNRHN